jgi:hypothetical protein
MEVRGEDDVLRNLRASLRTYLPVKPDAPKIIRSSFVEFDSILFWSCFRGEKLFLESLKEGDVVILVGRFEEVIVCVCSVRNRL